MSLFSPTASKNVDLVLERKKGQTRNLKIDRVEDMRPATGRALPIETIFQCSQYESSP